MMIARPHSSSLPPTLELPLTGDLGLRRRRVSRLGRRRRPGRRRRGWLHPRDARNCRAKRSQIASWTRSEGRWMESVQASMLQSVRELQLNGALRCHSLVALLRLDITRSAAHRLMATPILLTCRCVVLSSTSVCCFLPRERAALPVALVSAMRGGFSGKPLPNGLIAQCGRVRANQGKSFDGELVLAQDAGQVEVFRDVENAGDELLSRVTKFRIFGIAKDT